MTAANQKSGTRQGEGEPRRTRVVVPAAGGYERLTFQEDAAPVPGPGEVRIATRAIGVNYADCVVRMGLYASAKRYVGWPITPGFEAAGEVDAVGDGVTEVCVGDPVVGVTRFGGYTTHLVVPLHQVFPLPAGLTLSQGAAIPSVFMTAWFALCELAHPRPGQELLVHSAAGGVGGALVQLGKLLGCRVVGVVGAPHKVEVARALGADVVIDKSREPLWPAAESATPGGYHVICDANGVATLGESYRHLAAPGKLVVYGFHTMLPRRGGRPKWLKLAAGWLRTPRFNPLDMTGENRSVLAFNLSYLFDNQAILAEAMQQLMGWLAAGRLVPPTVSTYPLARVADAHRDLEGAQTTGKLILTV